MSKENTIDSHHRFHRRNEKMKDQEIEIGDLDLPSPYNSEGKIFSKQDTYNMDGNKMLWHLDRLEDFKNGKRFSPIHIDSGLSKGCNIKCHYCYGVTQGNFYKESAKKYIGRKALIDNYLRSAGKVGVRSIAFIGEAEPTLNPHIYEAIVVGKESGIDISVGTNGILFDTGKDGQAALEHLSWLRFNVSAGSDKSYRLIHASKEFNTLLEKIKFCVEYKKKNNLDLDIGIQMVLTPKDIAEVVPLAKLGSELGVDYFQVKHCSDTVENALGFYERLDDYSKFAPLLLEAESYGHDDYKVVVKWDKITNEGHRDYDQCLGAPFLLYTEGTGKVYSCGMFFDGKYEPNYRLGDLNKQTFQEIIESDHYWNVIDKVRNEIDVHKECYANCRTHSCNNFLWDVKDSGVTSGIAKKHSGGFTIDNPPKHKNFV